MVDTETTGLDWKRNAIIGYVLTFSPNPADSLYVPFRHAGNANVGGRNGPPNPLAWDRKLAPGEAELVRALDRSGLKLTFHNAAFDLKFLSQVGFTFQPRIEDTMINAPLIDELVGKYSLENCAARAKVQAKKSAEIVAYLMSKFPDTKNEREAMGHFWRLSGDDRMAVEYATGDGTTTWQLRDAQMVEIQNQELTLVHDIESRLIPILAKMMVKGIKIDEERLGLVIEEVDKIIDKAKNTLPSDFNVRSPRDVREWMEKHGCTDWPMTPPSKSFPDGQPSFPEGWLEEREAGRPIVAVRKYMTLRDTFLHPLRDTHMFKGRVHCDFHQLRNDNYGTITGRLSSSSPNMQAVPKHDVDTGKLFRSIFVPDEGMTWGSVDYSQCEPRLLAYYTRCKVLLDDYRNNPKADAHTAVSIAMAGGRWDQMDKAEQKKFRNERGKRVNQTLVTGGGKGVIVKKYKVDPNEVDQIWNDYFRAMPEIRPFQKKAEQRYLQRGYMLSLLGRRMRLQSRDTAYRATNRLLQGGNAEILKLKLVEVGEFLATQNANIDILLNCHDATDFQFDRDAEPVYRQCLEIMQDFHSENAVIKLDLPMTVDHDEGRNWAEATYGEG